MLIGISGFTKRIAAGSWMIHFKVLEKKPTFLNNCLKYRFNIIIQFTIHDRRAIFVHCWKILNSVNTGYSKLDTREVKLCEMVERITFQYQVHVNMILFVAFLQSLTVLQEGLNEYFLNMLYSKICCIYLIWGQFNWTDLLLQLVDSILTLFNVLSTCGYWARSDSTPCKAFPTSPIHTLSPRSETLLVFQIHLPNVAKMSLPLSYCIKGRSWYQIIMKLKSDTRNLSLNIEILSPDGLPNC